MTKNWHEIRDPIHVFIRLNSDERKVLDSAPFQRLRYIHQLGTTYLLYPGATHRRFEHSLGTMELATRVYDIITKSENIHHDSIREVVPEDEQKIKYWRSVLRMAALCHDLGHLPFSHAAEELLPTGWNHEKITEQIIASDLMKSIFENMVPPVKTEHIIKLTLGQKELKDQVFTDWETILSEIIVGDAFGVDRMDYLLRDSYHAGVAYGKFDHYRLIDTLRILPSEHFESMEPTLGIEMGGIHSAEALLLARYFIFTQLYFHSIRRIYDIHLKDFLLAWLRDKKFPIEPEEHLKITDNEVLTELRKASSDSKHSGNEPARKIVERDHHKLLWERNSKDVTINPQAGEQIRKAACSEFGEGKIKYDKNSKGSGVKDFPVIMDDGTIVSSLQESQVLNSIPDTATEFVYVSPEYLDKAKKWLNENREKIIKPIKEN